MPVARNGDPDDEFYSEPTQYANYGGSGGQAYSELPAEQTGYPQPDYGHPTDYGHAPAPEPPAPWYRKPGPLVGLGALAAVILALAIYAVVQLAGGSSGTSPTTTGPNDPSASVAPEPAPGGTQTVTESPSATEATETTEAPSTTSEAATETTTAPPSVSTSTVTETQTVRPTRTFPTTLPTLFPRPGNGGDGGGAGQ